MDFAEADALNSAIRRLAMRHRGRALELLARLKLYPGQEFVLMDLAQHGPRIQAQIADAVGCEPPSVTLMVRKLETVGYVRRRPAAHDRRAVLVELTDLGRAVSEQVRDLWITLADDTVDDLPSPTPSELADLLARLAANLVAHVGTAADHPGTEHIAVGTIGIPGPGDCGDARSRPAAVRTSSPCVDPVAAVGRRDTLR